MDSTPSSVRAPAEESASARVIAGKYRLIERLGRGGRGEVYRALQVGLDREVALKLVAESDAEVRARFVREAKIAAEIKHPCVVAIFDAGIDEDGTPYCAMELLEGETLDARIGRERLPAGEAVALVASVASALQAVHQKGFLHRDVKPSNIFLARREDGGVDPKLIDFGIAKRVKVEPEVVERVTMRGLGKGPGPKPTSPGMIVGTPRYLAPEQILGNDLDARCDVYALAVTLYEALAGAPPFVGGDIGELLANIVCEPPEPLTERAPDANIPAALDREIRRALAKEPADRHASAADFAASLWAALAAARIESSAPPPAPIVPVRSRAPHVAVAIAAALALALGVVWMRRPAPPKPAPVAAPPVTAAPSVVATAEPPKGEPEVTPAATATATTAPLPRAKGARPTAASTSAVTAAPAAQAPPAPNLRMDDLKVPY